MKKRFAYFYFSDCSVSVISNQISVTYEFSGEFANMIKVRTPANYNALCKFVPQLCRKTHLNLILRRIGVIHPVVFVSTFEDQFNVRCWKIAFKEYGHFKDVTLVSEASAVEASLSLMGQYGRFLVVDADIEHTYVYGVETKAATESQPFGFTEIWRHTIAELDAGVKRIQNRIPSVLSRYEIDKIAIFGKCSDEVFQSLVGVVSELTDKPIVTFVNRRTVIEDIMSRSEQEGYLWPNEYPWA